MQITSKSLSWAVTAKSSLVCISFKCICLNLSNMHHTRGFTAWLLSISENFLQLLAVCFSCDFAAQLFVFCKLSCFSIHILLSFVSGLYSRIWISVDPVVPHRLFSLLFVKNCHLFGSPDQLVAHGWSLLPFHDSLASSRTFSKVPFPKKHFTNQNTQGLLAQPNDCYICYTISFLRIHVDSSLIF